MPDDSTIFTYFRATQYLNISKHSSKYRTSFIDHIPGWQGFVFYTYGVTLQGTGLTSSGGSITSCLVLPSHSVSWLRSLVISRTQQSSSSLAACLHDFSVTQRYRDSQIHIHCQYIHLCIICIICRVNTIVGLFLCCLGASHCAEFVISAGERAEVCKCCRASPALRNSFLFV